MTAKTYQGKTCKRGHSGERYVSSTACVECVRAAARRWMIENPELKRKNSREWMAAQRAKNPDRFKESARRSRVKHREVALERTKKWRAANKEKVRDYNRQYKQANAEAMRESFAKWNKANRASRTAQQNARHALIFNAVPSLTPEQQERINEKYEEARRLTEDTGIVHHVDHDRPLTRGGLHVPENLIVIPAKHNLAKSNRFASLSEYLQHVGLTHSDLQQ